MNRKTTNLLLLRFFATMENSFLPFVKHSFWILEPTNKSLTALTRTGRFPELATAAVAKIRFHISKRFDSSKIFDIGQPKLRLGTWNWNNYDPSIRRAPLSHVFTLPNIYFLNGPFLFAYFCLFNSYFNSKHVLPMTGFEPRISGIRSDRSANWATNTALPWHILQYEFTSSCLSVT